jgi:hypothetical protein
MKILEYNFADGFFTTHLRGDFSHTESYDHVTRSGEIIKFRKSRSGVTVDIPFFLVETIFYRVASGRLTVWSRSVDSDSTQLDDESLKVFRRLGFIPLSRSRFRNIEIFCSWACYEIEESGVSAISARFPISIDPSSSVDFNNDAVYRAFQSRISRDLLSSGRKPLILLSGGMDSRLLLSELLKLKQVDIHIQTHGMPRTGDVEIAEVILRLPFVARSARFHWLSLRDLTEKNVVENYQRVSRLIPPDRLLYFPSDHIEKGRLLFSGLYGDVIFGRNQTQAVGFSDYCEEHQVVPANSTDELLVRAYDRLPRLSKLYQTVLRCQKLTRLSFEVDKTSMISVPFLDNDVIALASYYKNFSYPSFVKDFMPEELASIWHQSSCSKFTSPKAIRLMTKIWFKVSRAPLSRPYFYGWGEKEAVADIDQLDRALGSPREAE